MGQPGHAGFPCNTDGSNDYPSNEMEGYFLMFCNDCKKKDCVVQIYRDYHPFTDDRCDYIKEGKECPRYRTELTSKETNLWPYLLKVKKQLMSEVKK